MFIGPPPLDTSTKAWLAQCTAKPPRWYVTLMDKAIRDMKGADIWEELVFWYWFYTPDEQVAYLNIKDPTTSAAAAGGGTWTFEDYTSATPGVTGDGAASYLGSGYNNNTSPSADGDNHMGVWSTTNGSDDYDAGTATGNVRLGLRNSGNGALQIRLNSSAGANISQARPTTVGHYCIDQSGTGTTSWKGYINGSQHGSSQNFSTSLSADASALRLAHDIAGTISTKTFLTWHQGGSLSATQHAKLTKILYNLRRGISSKLELTPTTITTASANPWRLSANSGGLTLNSHSCTAQVDDGGANYNLRYQNDPAGEVVRFEYRNGDNPGNGDRCEFRSAETYASNTSFYFAGSYYFETLDLYSGWNIPFQLHADDNEPGAASMDGPAFNFSLTSAGKLTIHTNCEPVADGGISPAGGTTHYTSTNALETGRWYHFVGHLKWDPTTTSNNIVKVWQDGVLLCDASVKFNSISDSGSYWKAGFYCGPSGGGTNILWLANPEWGTSTDIISRILYPKPVPF